jgi:hypothetical protein
VDIKIVKALELSNKNPPKIQPIGAGVHFIQVTKDMFLGLNPSGEWAWPDDAVVEFCSDKATPPRVVG